MPPRRRTTLDLAIVTVEPLSRASDTSSEGSPLTPLPASPVEHAHPPRVPLYGNSFSLRPRQDLDEEWALFVADLGIPGQEKEEKQALSLIVMTHLIKRQISSTGSIIFKPELNLGRLHVRGCLSYRDTLPARYVRHVYSLRAYLGLAGSSTSTSHRSISTRSIGTPDFAVVLQTRNGCRRNDDMLDPGPDPFLARLPDDDSLRTSRTCSPSRRSSPSSSRAATNPVIVYAGVTLVIEYKPDPPKSFLGLGQIIFYLISSYYTSRNRLSMLMVGPAFSRIIVLEPTLRIVAIETQNEERVGTLQCLSTIIRSLTPQLVYESLAHNVDATSTQHSKQSQVTWENMIQLAFSIAAPVSSTPPLTSAAMEMAFLDPRVMSTIDTIVASSNSSNLNLDEEIEIATGEAEMELTAALIMARGEDPKNTLMVRYPGLLSQVSEPNTSEDEASGFESKRKRPKRTRKTRIDPLPKRDRSPDDDDGNGGGIGRNGKKTTGAKGSQRIESRDSGRNQNSTTGRPVGDQKSFRQNVCSHSTSSEQVNQAIQDFRDDMMIHPEDSISCAGGDSSCDGPESYFKDRQSSGWRSLLQDVWLVRWVSVQEMDDYAFSLCSVVDLSTRE